MVSVSFTGRACSQATNKKKKASLEFFRTDQCLEIACDQVLIKRNHLKLVTESFKVCLFIFSKNIK